MKEKLKKMSNDQLRQRVEELRGIADNPESRSAEELEQLAEERQMIDEILNERRAEAAREQLRRDSVASGQIVSTPVGSAPQEQRTAVPGVDSPEYRNAWLKNLASEMGVTQFGEMTQEERSAFVHTTANTEALVPLSIMNRIIELVDSEYPILNDATPSSMVQGFAIPRHKSIEQGDAAVTSEGVANDDEEDDFDYLPLTGVEIKKHLDRSRKMKWQSISAFEDWIVTNIADRIGVAKEGRILSQLVDATYGIAAANIGTGVEATDANIRAWFAKIKGKGQRVVYANAYTIWNIFAGINDGAGNKAFIPSPMADPITQGVMYGCIVKLDDNLADKVMLAGIPKKILANNFEELFIQKSIHPKSFVETIAGYSLFDAGLENPKSFVKVTFQ